MTSADADVSENLGRYWGAMLVGSVALLVGWCLPFATLEETGFIGGGDDQVVRDFSRTVWFWDLLPGTVPLLLAPLILFVVNGLRRPEAASPIALMLLVALSANTYLAASIADRSRDVPVPAALAEPEPTARCELVEYPPTKRSCALGLEGQMSELDEEVTQAGYDDFGLSSFRTGIGSHLFITISFLMTLGSAWVLLRRRMSRFGAGLVIALGVSMIYVVVIFDTVDELR